MRELKFRVWSEEDKEYRTDCDVFRLFHGKTGCPATIYNDEGDRFDIEQYTGLKDKNGKEIYEGDILESTWNGDKAVVVWNNAEGEWEHYADFNTHSKYSGSVVIGNIHENPELLGEEEWS
jgi:hypothetical protein